MVQYDEAKNHLFKNFHYFFSGRGEGNYSDQFASKSTSKTAKPSFSFSFGTRMVAIAKEIAPKKPLSKPFFRGRLLRGGGSEPSRPLPAIGTNLHPKTA